MPIIAPFDPWENTICTCPEKYSLSPYTGCGHGCLYCYASAYIPRFFSPRPKVNFLKRLNTEIKKIPVGSTIALANSSDPYMPLEKKLHLTRSALSVLKDYDLKIMLVTKSSSIREDLELIKKFKHIVVCITLTTLDERLAKKLEPGACPPTQRLKAINTLSRHIPVICRFDPLIPGLNTSQIAKTISVIKQHGARQVITSTYKARPDNLKRMCAQFSRHKALWHKLYLQQGERESGYIYLPAAIRGQYIKEVCQAAHQQGLEFSSCREAMANFNTKPCDGSYFL